MIEAGTVLQNRYRVEKQIGQGGMGAVYIATDERFGSVVAIKETLVMETNFRKAIEREARLLNSLKHAALPRVSDHFEEDNGQFIVMEYIAGDDLSEMMEREQKAFPEADVINWADQLLDALDFLHNQEIPVIHRDIKPQNLKLTPRGQIILLDFGLAKGNPSDVSHQTAAKSIFGYSRSYASLEQIQGTGTDPRSDLYSLAATLYHLVTGVPPEDALTRAMHVLSEKDDTLELASDVNPNVSKGFAGVLQRAMALNGNQRPQTANEMREMLRERENYAVEGTAKTNLENALNTGILAQETRLMGGTNVQNPAAQSQVNTQILPDNESVLTAIRTDGNVNKATNFYTEVPEQKTNRAKAFGAAALGGLLLVGSAIGGVYLFNPQLFGANSATQQVVETNSSPANAQTANSASDIANSNTVFVEKDNKSVVNDADKTIQGGEKTVVEANPKTAQTDKNAKTVQTNGGKIKVQDGKEQIIVDGETVRIGNMKITDEGIETPDMIIDDNGVRPKNPPRPPNVGQKPLLTREELQKLTPEQRRKLKIIRRNQIMRGNPPPDAPEN
ncbi:MAG TPA: serine/threonine-protein kinase [Pyrinomonadaceae bacterium]|nr:serine/threonine-protein kinase [Pyrinomonadaceae bacterium]